MTQDRFYDACNVPDLKDEERARIDRMYQEKEFLEVIGMVIELERDVKALKESERTKAEMNDKLQKENTDLKWQVENLEDEKKPLEDEIQSGKEQIDELNNEIDRIRKAAAVQSGQIRKLQTANEAVRAAANYWWKESKNSRHYAKKCERIIAELVDNGQ
jgi:peptidoglycan hydrolase CwlO-like protein